MSFVQFLRDPIWQFVGVLIALIALLMTIPGKRYITVFRIIFTPVFIILNYWRATMVILLAASVCFVLYFLYKQPLIILATVIYTIIIVLLVGQRSLLQPHERIEYLCLSLDEVANTSIRANYADPPSNGKSSHIIPFTINTGPQGCFEAAATKADRTVLHLQRPISNAYKVALLINAGNALIQYKGSIFGSIKLLFDNGDEQNQDLILGENIREWAPGNASPGELVDTVTNPGSMVFWEGKNHQGNKAVIDCLEIWIGDRLKKRSLKEIIISRNTNIRSSAILVAAITVVVSSSTLRRN